MRLNGERWLCGARAAQRLGGKRRARLSGGVERRAVARRRGERCAAAGAVRSGWAGGAYRGGAASAVRPVFFPLRVGGFLPRVPKLSAPEGYKHATIHSQRFARVKVGQTFKASAHNIVC